MYPTQLGGLSVSTEVVHLSLSDQKCPGSEKHVESNQLLSSTNAQSVAACICWHCMRKAISSIAGSRELADQHSNARVLCRGQYLQYE